MIANSKGQAILDGTVSKANFRGPPILMHGDWISVTDARWTNFLTFADIFDAPLIGIDKPLVETDHEDITPLFDALTHPAYARCFAPAQVAVPVNVTVSGGVFETTPLRLCGPIFTVSSSSNIDVAYPVWQGAWTMSAYFTRAPNGHRYGFGMSAIGNNVPDERPTPPIYPLYIDTIGTMEDNMSRIGAIWKRGEAPTQQQMDSLLTLEATRPGIARWVAPMLVYYVLNRNPTV